MDLIEDKFIRSNKERICGVCNTPIPKDVTHVFQTWVDEETETYYIMRICRICDIFDYVDRINDAWSSEDGAPLDGGGYIKSAVRFDSEALQNYLLDEVSEDTDDRFRAGLRRQLTLNTGNNWLASWDKKEEEENEPEENEPDDNQLRLF